MSPAHWDFSFSETKKEEKAATFPSKWWQILLSDCKAAIHDFVMMPKNKICLQDCYEYLET